MSKNVVGIDELCRQLGALVWFWGVLELSLAHLLAGLLGPPHNLRVPLFYAVTSNQARIDMLQMALECLNPEPEIKEQASKLISRFQRLNKTRNTYIHSVYVSGHPNNEIYKTDMTTPQHTDAGFASGYANLLNGAEIKNHCDAVEKLRHDVAAFNEKFLGVPPLPGLP